MNDRCAHDVPILRLPSSICPIHIDESKTANSIRDCIGERTWNKLYHFQRDNVVFLAQRDGCGIPSVDQGMGKSAISLLTAFLYLEERPLLILTKASIAGQLPQEIKRWIPISDSQICVCTGNKRVRYANVPCERKQGNNHTSQSPSSSGQSILRRQMRQVAAASVNADPVEPFIPCAGCISNMKERQNPPPKTYEPLNGLINIMTHTQAKLRVDELLVRHFKVVIFDESAALKKPESQVTIRLSKVIQQAKRRILCTGTPMDGRAIDGYAQVRAVQPTLFLSDNAFYRALL